jgi:hypothetical protein
MGAVSRRLFPGQIVVPRIPTPEEHAMNFLQPNTAVLPPALRALALGLLIETGVSLLNKSQEESPVPTGQDERGADGEGELWQNLRGKCSELSALVLQADHPDEAASYVLGYLPKHFDFLFEHLYGRKRRPFLDDCEAVRQIALRDGWQGADPA